MLATITDAGTVKVWDMATTGNPSVLQQAGAVYSVAFSPDGKSLVGTGIFPAKVLDLATGEIRETWAVTGFGRLSPDWATFASRATSDNARFSTGSDYTVKVSDAKSGIERASLPGHTGGVMSFAFSPNSKMLASCGGDETVKLWDVSAQKLQTSLAGGGSVYSVAFSPDGKMLAAGNQFNRVRLWDIASGREVVGLQEQENSGVFSIVFSPNGKTLAVGNYHGKVRLWEVSSGRQLPGSFQGHTDAIRSMAFSPDGLTLATGSDDKTVRLWDVTTGQERLTLSGQQGAVNAIAFAPNGKTLATGNGSTINLSRAATDELAAAWKEELDPTDPGSPRADNSNGDRLLEHGRMNEAEQAYRRALPRLEQLVREFPDNPAYTQELAANLLDLSFVLNANGFSAEASGCMTAP